MTRRHAAWMALCVLGCPRRATAPQAIEDALPAAPVEQPAPLPRLWEPPWGGQVDGGLWAPAAPPEGAWAAWTLQVGRGAEVSAWAHPGAWSPDPACLDVWEGAARVSGADREGGACVLPDGTERLSWTWRAPCAQPGSATELTLEVRVPLGHRVRTMPEIEALVVAVDETIRNAASSCGR